MLTLRRVLLAGVIVVALGACSSESDPEPDDPTGTTTSTQVPESNSTAEVPTSLNGGEPGVQPGDSVAPGPTFDQ